MNSTAFSLLANSNAEVDENQEVELTFGSLNFYIGPSGTTRLSDSTKSVPSAGKAERMTASGSSVGSSTEAKLASQLSSNRKFAGRIRGTRRNQARDHGGRNRRQVKGYRQQK
jgi:hypothetical protein